MTDKILSQRTRYWLAGKRDRRPLMALSVPANLASSCPVSVADRESFERSEHFR